VCSECGRLNAAALRGKAADVTLPFMSITAIVENDTIKLPVHVPDGTRVEITVTHQVHETTSAKDETADWLQALVGKATSGLSTDEIMRLTRGED